MDTTEPSDPLLDEIVEPEKQHLFVPDFNPVEALLQKLELWLLQQPEWAVILSAPRAARRQAITLLSKRILTIPSRKGFR